MIERATPGTVSSIPGEGRVSAMQSLTPQDPRAIGAYRLLGRLGSRRHGPGLSGPVRPRPHRRDQAGTRRTRRTAGVPRPVPPRGTGRPPGRLRLDRPRTGRRHRGRRALGRHRIRRRPLPARHRHRPLAHPRGGGLRCVRAPARAFGPHPGGRSHPRPPGDTRRRAHPPRPQALQHPADDRRATRHRLRYSPGTRHRHRRRRHPHRGPGRIARLHGARAGAGRAGDPGVRRVLSRLGTGVRLDREAGSRSGPPTAECTRRCSGSRRKTRT